jgi:hypothetical protein
VVPIQFSGRGVIGTTGLLTILNRGIWDKRRWSIAFTIEIPAASTALTADWVALK